MADVHADHFSWTLYPVGGILMTIGAATMVFAVGTETFVASVYGFSIMLGAGTGLTLQAGYTVGGVKTMMKTGSGLDVQRAISMLNLSQLGFQMGSLLIGGQIFRSVAVKNLSHVLQGLGFSRQEITSAIPRHVGRCGRGGLWFADEEGEAVCRSCTCTCRGWWSLSVVAPLVKGD